MKEKDIREKMIVLYDAHPLGELAVLKKWKLHKKLKRKDILSSNTER